MSKSDPNDRVAVWVVVANHARHKFIREGAKCYVMPWLVGSGSTQVVVLAGGRWIEKWTRTHRLTNVRAQRIEAVVGSRVHGCRCADEHSARDLAARMAQMVMSAEIRHVKSAARPEVRHG